MPVETKYKVGDKVLCINDVAFTSVGLKEGLVYTVKECKYSGGRFCIGLEELPPYSLYACRFELYKEEATNESKALDYLVGELLHPPKDLPTDNQEIPKGNTPYFTISHFDGESVKTEMKIAGHITWMKVLREVVSFLRGLGFQIRNKDIALHIDREPSDWQGKYYVD